MHPFRITFTQLEAVTPKVGQPGFYPGVLVIEKGAAKGHYAVQEKNGMVVNYDWENPDHAELKKYPLVMGDDILDDVVKCGAESGNTKCKLDHGSTVRDIVGDYSNFRREGDQVRADLTLMNSTPHREYVEELFAKFAKKVGNSIDFNYRYEIQGEIAVARCIKLNSVDIVDAPAATNSLFNEQTNPTSPTNMALSKEDLEAIGAVVKTQVDTRFSALETGIDTRLGKIEKTVTKLEEKEEDDKEKKEKKEEESEYEEGDDKKKDVMSAAKLHTAVLSAVREIFPKAAVENFVKLSSGAAVVEDEYAQKVALCEAAGLKGTQITRHIAAKFPEIYNAKFGNGGGQKGGASTKV